MIHSRIGTFGFLSPSIECLSLFALFANLLNLSRFWVSEHSLCSLLPHRIPLSCQYDKCAHCAGSGSHCRAGLFDGYERRLARVRLHFAQTVQPQENISYPGQVGGAHTVNKDFALRTSACNSKVALMIHKLEGNVN